MGHLSRKSLQLSLILAAFLASFNGLSFAIAQDMTIVSWGGAYSASQNKAYFQPYMAQNPSINIIDDSSAAEAVSRLRAMQQAGNVPWDVIDMVAADAIRACDEGLALEIDPDTQLAPAPDGTPASEDFGEFLISPCFVPQSVSSTTFGFRTDMVGDNPPDEICDVFDLENYPGKRSLERRPVNNMEWALICDGVAESEVYDVLSTPEGVDRALAKLDSIKNQVVWWSAGAETPQLLVDGEVVMGSSNNGRLFALIQENKQPVGMLWDAQVLNVDGWVIPAGLPPERKARALDYVKFATDAQRLADQAGYISFGPARKSSAPLVSKHAETGIDMAPHMPTEPSNLKNSILSDHEFWMVNGEDINARFQSWLEGKEPWVSRAKPKTEDAESIKGTVSVLFGTTRQYSEQSPPEHRFKSTTHDKLRLGLIEVHVPENHLIGGLKSSDSSWISAIRNFFLGSDRVDEFVIKDLIVLSESEFSNVITNNTQDHEKTGFIYIHGFATPFDFAAKRTAQLAFDFRSYHGVPMFFSWPSKGQRSRNAYQHDEEMIERNQDALIEFLKTVLQNPKLERVHLLAHSLGTRLLSRVMKELSDDDPILFAKIGEVVMAAPDIGTSLFGDKYKEIFVNKPARTTIYASSSDWALDISKNWHISPRLGEIRDEMPDLIGLDVVDISGLDGSFFRAFDISSKPYGYSRYHCHYYTWSSTTRQVLSRRYDPKGQSILEIIGELTTPFSEKQTLRCKGIFIKNYCPKPGAIGICVGATVEMAMSLAVAEKSDVRLVCWTGS